ncbi:hypothetical protein GWI33_022451 [Rhynchophorus ferrugineus]|uniref:Kinesin-like protein n=1 Tax=Rhynchophorus ferrugineus TaxID=354439 RepID=A0A834MHM5_RHYFE|nr:hypothetical protein GWI33_022451 [Rhynchophorus ferrugineus]
MKRILSIGDDVIIKRTNGKLQKAMVSEIDYDFQCIKVEWYENDDTKGKEIHFNNVASLNPNLIIDKEDESPSMVEDTGQGSSTSNAIKNTKSRLTHYSRVEESEELSIEGKGLSGARTTRSATESSYKNKDNQVLKKINQLEKSRLDRRTQQAILKVKKDEILKKSQNQPYWQISKMIEEYRQDLSVNTKVSTSSEVTLEHPITVAVRKRPLSDLEIQKNEIDIVTIPNTNQIIVHEPKQKVDLTKFIDNHIFKFDYTLDENCSNETIYKFTAQPLIKNVFDGGYATCFAYGQTGSGKTYTMSGNEENSEAGIYTLTAQDIFKNVYLNKTSRKIIISCSFFEIYTKKVYDLLNHKTSLKILEDAQQQVQIVGLTEQVVHSVEEVLELICEGNKTRTFGHTSANSQSSRSHVIFQYYLRVENNPDIYGKFSLIDLAGNERGADTFFASKTTRFESSEINQSLLCLKECIRALGRKDCHLPFRGSKLTQVLRDSFIGNQSKTCMIAMVSPGIGSCDNTLNTLRYANRVKELSGKDKLATQCRSEIKPQTNDLTKKSEYIKQNKDIIKVLQTSKNEAEELLKCPYYNLDNYYHDLNALLTDVISNLIKIKDVI